MIMARFRSIRLQFYFLAAFACGNSLHVSAQSPPPAPCLAYISDTQAPMWFEGIYMESHDNVKATRLLLEDLVNRKPLQAFILGDAVNLGYRENRWTIIDSALTRLRSGGRPVHACLGNHELMGKKAAGEKEFQQ